MSTSEHEGGGSGGLGGGPPDGVSRQEFSELAGAVSELRDAMSELRDAATPAERKDAREGVRDAKADLNAVARELGLDPKRLQAAAAEAKASDERERLRGIVTELLDEELAVDGGGEGGGEGGGKPKPEPEGGQKPEGGEKPKGGEKPPDDSSPTHEHWSDRPLSSLFGR